MGIQTLSRVMAWCLVHWLASLWAQVQCPGQKCVFPFSPSPSNQFSGKPVFQHLTTTQSSQIWYTQQLMNPQLSSMHLSHLTQNTHTFFSLVRHLWDQGPPTMEDTYMYTPNMHVRMLKNILVVRSGERGVWRRQTFIQLYHYVVGVF